MSTSRVAKPSKVINGTFNGGKAQPIDANVTQNTSGSQSTHTCSTTHAPPKQSTPTDHRIC
jgi:hypothetical protein